MDAVIRGNAGAAREMKKTIYQEDRHAKGGQMLEKAPMIAEVAR